MCLHRKTLTLLITAVFLSDSAIASETIVFSKRPAQPGDISIQTIECDLDMRLLIRQSGQVVQAQNQSIGRKQLRELTILNVGPNAPIQAQVQYDESSVALKTAGSSQDATAQPPTAQPVTGKSYLVVRDGNALTITYPNGTEPPALEKEIVRQNMESFGLPNPIANFFDKRQIRAGETVRLPTEVARELLGFPDTVKNITQFQLRLSEVKKIEDRQCAIFDIRLIANNAEKNSLKMDLAGSLILEVGTCRTVAVMLNGPVGASETHGPVAGQFEVASEGTIRVAVHADYTTKSR